MISQETYRQFALALPEVTEAPHFDKQAFKWRTRIFATLWVKENRAMLKLSLVDQSVFCAFNDKVFYPVPMPGANREPRLLSWRWCGRICLRMP
jgi:hypothetical protein